MTLAGYTTATTAIATFKDVTYKAVYNGEVVKTQVVTHWVGDAVAIPTSFTSVPFCDFEADVTEIGSETTELNVTVTWQETAPYKLSTKDSPRYYTWQSKGRQTIYASDESQTNDKGNGDTTSADYTFTFTLVWVDDTTFRLQANGLTVTDGQIYLADYQNPGKLGRYTADDGTKIQVAEIPTAPETVALTVTDAGYATFASQWPLDFTDMTDVKAYRAVVDTDAEEKVIKFEQVTGAVPAEEGLLIKGSFDNEVTANIPVATTAPAAIDNVFVGTISETYNRHPARQGTGPPPCFIHLWRNIGQR